MNIKKTFCGLVILFCTIANAKDIFEQNFNSDQSTFLNFKQSLNKANVVYIGECHKSIENNVNVTEVVRTKLIPGLFPLGFKTYYLEALPYFNHDVFKHYYADMYREEVQEKLQPRILEMTNYTTNPDADKKLTQDLINRKANLFGYGLIAFTEGNDEKMSYDQKVKLIADRAVESVSNEIDKQTETVKMVLDGGVMHNDTDTDFDRWKQLISGDRIKKLDSKLSYVAIDLIPLKYLRTKLPDVASDEEKKINETFKKNYLEIIGNKEDKMKKSIKPTLVELNSKFSAKSYADYVIFIP